MVWLDFSQVMQKIFLIFFLQWQMMENLVIVKVWEEIFQRKMEECWLWFQEVVNRRFCSQVVLILEEWEQWVFYVVILEYEQDYDWLKYWKVKFKRSLGDLLFVISLVLYLFSFFDYLIVQFLRWLQCVVYSVLYFVVSRVVVLVLGCCFLIFNFGS